MTAARPAAPIHPSRMDAAFLDAHIPALFGQLYEASSPGARRRLLEHLARPLNMLSLVAIADGAFALVGLRCVGQVAWFAPEDLHGVRASHVRALADYAQQVNVGAVDTLVELWHAPEPDSAMLAASLLTLLRQRALLRTPQGRDEWR